MRDLTKTELAEVNGGFSTESGAGLELGLAGIALGIGAPAVAAGAIAATVVIVAIDFWQD